MPEFLVIDTADPRTMVYASAAEAVKVYGGNLQLEHCVEQNCERFLARAADYLGFLVNSARKDCLTIAADLYGDAKWAQLIFVLSPNVSTTVFSSQVAHSSAIGNNWTIVSRDPADIAQAIVAGARAAHQRKRYRTAL